MRRDIMAAMAARPPKPWQGTSIDTETYQGWARLVCTPTEWSTIRRGDWHGAFTFLHDNGPSITCWNLRFDAEAVLKHLPEEHLRTLLTLERLDLEDWRVELIPWKMLRISRNGHRTSLFDIQPFYGSTLDAAARRFLGHGKRYGGVDPALLNTEPSAWRDLARVVRYCQNDADDTDRLTHYISQRYTTLGGSFNQPYSVAFVAADILMRDTEVPRLAPRMHRIAEEAYFGGWFDCIQRGPFDMAHLYDIKSAYPSELVQVEDAAKARWVESVRPKKDALHAVIRCRAEIDPDDYPTVAPLPYRRNKNRPVIYPTGTFDTTVLLSTYRRFEDLLTPLESWSYIPTGKTYFPYRRTVKRLVDFRSSSDALLGEAAKKGANSLYGKTLNTRMEKRYRLADWNLDHLLHNVVIKDGQPHVVEQIRRKGLLYNPLHAGIVTEGIRLRMWDAVMRDPSALIMVMTDGFLTSRALRGFGQKKAKKMGDLGHVAKGRLVSCGSGLYELEGYMVRTRGVSFSRSSGARPSAGDRTGGHGGWFDRLRGVKTRTVRFEDVRPAHLAECLGGTTTALVGGRVRTLGLKDANVFVTFVRLVDVTRDDKRVWPEIGAASRLLEDRFVSRPIHIDLEV